MSFAGAQGLDSIISDNGSDSSLRLNEIAGGDAEVDLDILLNSLGSGANSGSLSQSSREAGKSAKYNPLQLASNDLLRSFVNGPTAGGAANSSLQGSQAQKMKDKLNSHGLFGDDDAGTASGGVSNTADSAELPDGGSNSGKRDTSSKVLFQEDASVVVKAKPAESDHVSFRVFL